MFSHTSSLLISPPLAALEKLCLQYNPDTKLIGADDNMDLIGQHRRHVYASLLPSLSGEMGRVFAVLFFLALLTPTLIARFQPHMNEAT